MSDAVFRSEPLNLTSVRCQLVLGIVGPFHLHGQARHQSGHAHLLLAHVEPAFDFFHLSAVAQQDDNIAGVLSLDRHGGAAASVDHALDLGALRGSDAAGEHNGCDCHCNHEGDIL